ncbi:MAG: class I SAM-dependent methyltransferase [Bacteroidota bacterium]
MTIQDAQNMLSPARFAPSPQNWLDLGCGSGTFTLALAANLPQGSKITAIDQEPQQLPTHSDNGISISFIQADMEMTYLGLNQKVDGILLANALHYVANQKAFLQEWSGQMHPAASFILIEYDTRAANPWVPYPIPFNELPDLFGVADHQITKIGERSSIYGNNKMYAAQIWRS